MNKLVIIKGKGLRPSVTCVCDKVMIGNTKADLVEKLTAHFNAGIRCIREIHLNLCGEGCS